MPTTVGCASPRRLLVDEAVRLRRVAATRHPLAVPSDPTNVILNGAARDVLRPLGLMQKGRSRTWYDDRGWWLIVVEFQPSGFGRASYLNVGICWLWSAEPKSHTSFDLGYRIPKAGGSFESEQQWRGVVEELVRRAAAEVQRCRELVPDLAAAARECVRTEEGRLANLRERDGDRQVSAGWPTWHAAVASGLAGDVERAVHYFDHAAQLGLSGSGEEFWRPAREQAVDWSHLVQHDHPAFAEQVRRGTANQRRALRLDEAFPA